MLRSGHERKKMVRSGHDGGKVRSGHERPNRGLRTTENLTVNETNAHRINNDGWEKKTAMVDNNNNNNNNNP